jgi:fucose 4-O-acetylase-like acetyltransferase
MRKGWIDYARGFAIILVVYKHVLIGFTAAGIAVHDYIYYPQEFFYNLRMPLFFIVSGLFIRKSIERRSRAEFTRYKFDTILYPYLVWAVIYLTMKILAGSFINFAMEPSAYLDILIKPRTIDHFWYLYTLFVVIMLFAISYWTAKANRVMLLLGGVAMYCLSFLIFVDYFALNDVLFYFIFLVIGDGISRVFLQEKNLELLSSFKLFWMLLPIFLVSQTYWLLHLSGIVRFSELQGVGRVVCIPMVLVGCLFILNVSAILDKYSVANIIRYVGKHSLYIYMMHLMALAAVRVVLAKTPLREYPDVLFVLIFVAGIAIPIAIYHITMKLGMWYLYSPRKSHVREI